MVMSDGPVHAYVAMVPREAVPSRRTVWPGWTDWSGPACATTGIGSRASPVTTTGRTVEPPAAERTVTLAGGAARPSTVRVPETSSPQPTAVRAGGTAVSLDPAVTTRDWCVVSETALPVTRSTTAVTAFDGGTSPVLVTCTRVGGAPSAR